MRRIRSPCAASTSSTGRTDMPGSMGGYATMSVASAALLVWSARGCSVPGALAERCPPRSFLRARMIMEHRAILGGANCRRPAGMPGISGGFRHQPGHFGLRPVDTGFRACVEFPSRSSWPCEAFGKPQTSPALYARARRHATIVFRLMFSPAENPFEARNRRNLVSRQQDSLAVAGSPPKRLRAVAVPSQPI